MDDDARRGIARPEDAIAFFIRALDGGGAQRDMILLANALRALGRAVSILCLVEAGPLKALVDPGIPVVIVPGGKIRSAAPGLRRAIAALRPRVVVSAEAASNLLVLLVAKTLPRAGRPLVVLREVSSASVSLKHDPYLQTRLAYRALRVLYRHADAVVTLTEGASDDLARNFGVPRDRLALMASNAVITDPAAAAPAPDSARVPGLIVSVGRLSPEKDQATLIRAFAAMPDDGRTRLEIYGAGPEGPALGRLIRDLGIGHRASLEGFVRDPFPVFRRASLAVSSSRFEGFGNVLIEAMSCGTPIVATDCPYGPSEILAGGRYGALVPVGDVAALSSAMARALAAPADRRALRERAAPHTLARAGAALSAIIDDVSARAKASEALR